MNYIVVSVKDRALDAFGRPMFLQSAGQAVRAFSDEVNRSSADNEMFKHPDDFDLYEIGTFVDDNARFVLLDEPRILVLGKAVKLSRDTA